MNDGSPDRQRNTLVAETSHRDHRDYYRALATLDHRRLFGPNVTGRSIASVRHNTGMLPYCLTKQTLCRFDWYAS